jgi:cytochrome o ubiquinol oxidase subunit 2
MPGMETKLHAVINKPGEYRRLLGQLQRRRLLGHALPPSTACPTAISTPGCRRSSADGNTLSREDYLKLERPSENEPVHYYAPSRPASTTPSSTVCVEPRQDVRRAT